jgi:hypothetical protein
VLRTPHKSIGRPHLPVPVRTGLVILGTIIAVIGAGLILVLFFLSGGPTSSSEISFAVPSLSGYADQTWTISGPASGAGSITLSWTTSAAANVSLWPATHCVSSMGWCPTGPPVLSWTRALSGNGTVSSPNASTYILRVSNPGVAPLSFSAKVSESYNPGIPVAIWSEGVIVIGGITLLVIGGIALFLGLFLPGGVYRDPDRGMATGRPPGLPPEEPGSEDTSRPPR